MKEIKNLTIGAFDSHNDLCFNEKLYLNNNILFKDNIFQYDKLQEIEVVNDEEELKKMISGMELHNDILYFFKDNSKEPLSLNELEELGIIKKIENYDNLKNYDCCDTYEYTFDINEYFKKYWEK